MAILKTSSKAGSAVLTTSQNVSASSSSTFTIKLTSMSLDVQTPVIDATPEITGSGLVVPQQPRIRHTGKVGGSITLNGLTIDNSVIGLGSLPAEDMDVKITLGETSAGTAHSLEVRMTITSLKVNWARSEVGVPVSIVGAITSYVDGGTLMGAKETIA